MHLRRYLLLFRPYTGGLVVAAGLLAVSAAIPGLAVWLLQATLDRILAGAEVGPLALALVALAAVEGAVLLGRTRLTKAIAWRVAADLRARLHAHLLRLSPRQQGSTGARLAALTHDVDELQYGVSALVTVARNPLTLAILGATAAAMAPTLALASAGLVPIVALAAWAAGSLLRRRAAAVRERRSALIELAQEQLAGLRTVQSFTAEEAEHLRFVALAEADRSAKVRLEVDRLLPSAVVRILATAALGLLLWVGGGEVARGSLQPGELVGFVVALGLMNRPLSGLGEVWSLLQRSLGALERVEDLLATAPDVLPPPAPVPLPDGPLPLRWAAVTADHGAGPVLHALDLVARPGEILAIVGPSGAGKSTLLALVGRQLDPVGGAVQLGGVDVRALDPAVLRGAVSVVRQEGFLFARTVHDNVALGTPDASPADVRDALRLAGADLFVDRLPDGVDTRLDEAAHRLSGGERQRLCLARALLRGAPVLLLDEATNQVDGQTERQLLDALQRLRDGRTIVMVAHDPGVAAAADRVAVVVDGRVVEVGTHAELLARGGRYAAITEPAPLPLSMEAR